jgi:hypothetical protein
VSPPSEALSVDSGVDDCDVRDLDITTFWALRTSVERGERVTWRAKGQLSLAEAAQWLHLPAPVAGGGCGGDYWRCRHRFGLFYVRWGVDFCRIRDRRPDRESSVVIVDDSELLLCIRKLKFVTDHICTVCAELHDFGLVFADSRLRAFAPVRLTFPPIPFSGV